ncbi:MAG: cellulose biosynthesis cyclic di-GMP-binding regulatory protein BcsB [Candidatus Dormibacteraeota bacterium]|nr:cellulose biosynthesis cyclic di-GMP-binding regulatory protein BcsB [Candidatus Dormibacteraeota bacterium]
MAFGWLLVVRFGVHVRAAAAIGSLALLSASTPVDALAATSSASPAPGPSASPSVQPPAGAEPAQEVSLESLGMGSQSVQGGSGSVEVYLPPPAGPLASAGSFVRVFFGHSPLLDAAASSLTIAVNGQPLTSVRLDGSNADGSAFETRVVGSALHGDGPNLLQARFEFKLAGAPATGDSAAYARLEPQTFLHYQLYGQPGSRPPPRLESYPFPFAARAGGSGFGFVLPRPAAEADLRAALRLAADLGRRALGQPAEPEVVTAASSDWLRSAGKPAVVVGTIGRLPLAERVLQTAGFSGSSRGWSAPDGRQLQPGDGVLATVTSPFDGQSPLLLVTGFSDDGLARAAAALTGAGGAAGPLPAGTYAVLREGTQGTVAAAAGSWTRPGEALSLDALASDAGGGGGGSRYVVLPFAAAPVDPGLPGTLELRSRGAPPSFQLNGHPLEAAPSRASGGQLTTLRQSFSGSLLHPGLNAVSVRFPASAGTSAGVLGGSLRLPPAPIPAAALDMLPVPLLSDPGGLLVTLSRLDDGVLSAAARAFAALGSRGGSVQSLRVVEASSFDARSLGRASLFAVGGSGGNPGLDRLRRQLAIPQLHGLSGGGQDAVVALQALPSVATSSSEHHFQLWIDASSPLLLVAGADALYRHPLAGSAISLDAGGRLQALRTRDAAPGPAPEPPAALRLLLVALVVIAAAATLLGIGWQVRRPLEPAW